MPESYTIKQGDTLYRVARDHNLEVADILAENPDIKDPAVISVGQVIQLPGDAVNQYIVKAGDTMYSIARTLEINPSDLISANAQLADPDTLEVGQVLNLPGEVKAPVPASDPAPVPEAAVSNTYTVKSGDTLSEIAVALKVKTSDLMGWNPEIINPDDIYDGQVLKLEGSPEPVAAASRTNLSPPAQVRQPNESGSWRSTSIAKEAIDNAWSAVEGRPVSSVFNASVVDRRPLIVIDPGHGAYSKSGYLDKGVVSRNGLTEVDVVDPVALRLAQRMESLGFRVAFTRQPGEEYRYSAADAPGRLGSRAKFAHALEDQTQAPYTLFVSMHANGAESTSARGMEIQIDNARSGRDGPPSSPHSYALASSVLETIEGYGGLRNRGIKTYNASVLDKMERGDPGYGQQPDAAILIEFGFLSNSEDARVLDDMRRNPAEMADRIAAGILNYIDSRDPSPTGPGNNPAISV